MELTKDAGQGGDADRILEGIILMASAIGVQVVGVGVEKDKQLQFLARAGCDYAQGFLFSRPLRQDDFEALLRRDRQIKPSEGVRPNPAFLLRDGRPVLVFVQVCQSVQLKFGLRVVKAFIDNERLMPRQVVHLFMVYTVVC